MNSKNCVIVFLLSFLFVAGCSHGDNFSQAPQIKAENHYVDSGGNSWKKPISAANAMGGMGGMGMGMAMDMEGEKADRFAKPPAETATPEPGKRRVIFDSNIELRVDHFEGVEARVSTLVQRHGGFISEANVSHQVARARSGYWTIRIPVSAYRQMLDSIGSLGELESRKENANDVTEEFYDLEARIKNKQRLEERIAKLLDESKSELRKMIEVENELARVREEIERMQGRLRFLTHVTDLSTVHLRIIEREKQPEPLVATTFSDRITNAWNSALTQATNTAQNAIVACVENVFRIATFVTLLAMAWLATRIFLPRVSRRETLPAS